MLTLLLTAALAVAGPFEDWLAAQPAAPADKPEYAADYRWAAEVYGDIATAMSESPWPVEVEEIGRSTEGRPLWAFHLTDPQTPPERSVLVFGGIHALEWVSVEVATEALLWLVEHPRPGVRVTVIPMLNPDGRAKVEADLAREENKYRRGNQNNVDLNRDFAVNREARGLWKAVIPKMYKTSATPLSQPETRALDALADRERYARAVSLHCFGKFIYFPWSGRFHRTPDHAEFLELGRAMEAAQGDRPYRARQLSRWGFFFRAQGSEIDHLYGVYGTRAYLIELTSSGIRPWRPRTIRRYFSWYNPRNPALHTEKGLRAVQELVRHPPLPGEGQGPPAPHPRVDIHQPAR